MIDMPQQVAEWVARIYKSALTKELVNVMYSVPKSEREKILAAVLSANESSLKFCADSIVVCSTFIYKDNLIHLKPEVDSLLSLVPTLAPTFEAFCPTRSHGDKFLVAESFEKVLSSLCRRHDLPSNFLFAPLLESRFTPELHGLMITHLAGGALHDADLEWLGNNRAQLAPYADTLYEHGRVDREFCERLLDQNSPPLSSGTL